MASPLLPIIFTILAIVTPSIATVKVNTSAIIETLTVDFYKRKCPEVEQIVYDVLKKHAQQKPGSIPGVIRLHFHDCFITGCDGSILLTPEKYNNYNSEMGHPSNGVSLRGMEVIDDIKAEVEKQCPTTVSCADILAFAARDAIVLSGNPHYSVLAGRKDGVLVDGNLAGDLPKGSFSIELLTEMYAAKGLTVDDLVILEGSHSIGQTRCQGTIAEEASIQNVTESGQILNKQFKSMVIQKYCPPAKVDQFFNLTAPLNPAKPENSAWGVSFYDNIKKGLSLIPSDLAMAVNVNTKGLVNQYANDSQLWMKKFNEAMIKIGKINVITGNQGEIRKHCGLINAVNLPA
ncbi:hypothetical protein RND81_04G133400 [Saponaria officinalis]|uniref:Peroxidase n=1 Tax=Saponaria officinalis TaxID=3572 RepID=A0AAW1LMJ8_SAPOF